MPPSPVLHVRLARSELAALDARARAAGVRRSELVRRLLRAGLAACASDPRPAGRPQSQPTTRKLIVLLRERLPAASTAVMVAV